MKENLTEKYNYIKEIIVPIIAIGTIFTILANLEAPQSKNKLQATTVQEGAEEQKNRQPSSEKRKLKTIKQKKIVKNRPLSLREKLDYTFLKAKAIEACFENDCDYPDSDPREYSLSIHKDLSLRINKYKNFWVKSWSKLADTDKKYIVGLLNHDDGFVKKEILSLLNSLPKEEASKHVDAVLNDVIAYHDSAIIPQALEFLSKTQTPQNEVKIATQLSLALKQGSPHVSQAISKRIQSFISPRTVEVYADSLPKMPESAPETTYLSSALTEYEMIQSGG